MKIIQLIFFISFISLSMLFSGDSAYPLENGKRTMGIIQPRISGIKNNMELSTHPILFVIKPNVKLKIFHGEIKNVGIASRYSFDYPTHFLRLIQHRGYFAFISEDPDIGDIQHFLVLQGEFLATKKLSNYSLSRKLGMSLCPGCEMDMRHLIDYDLIYPRMALYHYGMGANMGADLDYVHSEKINIKVDVDILLLPEEQAFFEHKLLFHYNLSEKYTISVGYKFSYGHYPFNKKGEYWWNMFPLIDLSWQWTK